MDVSLYASHHGVLLLVPACMHPSQDAERRYGPLQFRGQGPLEDVPDRDCRARIEADLDRCAYALVHQREARCIARPPGSPRRFEANLQNLNTAVISKGFFLIRRSLPRH